MNTNSGSIAMADGIYTLPVAKRASPDQALVSVLIPVQDEAEYVQDALSSVLNQTWRNLEVIVVDDHSSDDTYAIVEEIARADDRVLLLKAEGRGKVCAFNQAWRASYGDIVALFAGDDVMPPNSIETRVRLLEEGFHDVAAGKVKSFSSEAKYDGLVLPRRGPSLGGVATAFSRRFCDRIFPIPEELPNEDSWTKLHIDAFCPKVAWNDSIVGHYRIHKGNSMAFGAPFATKRAVLDKRCAAYDLFLEKYESHLTREFVSSTRSLSRLHKLRSQGRYIAMLFVPHVRLRQKLAAISYSTPGFYAVRVLLERYLLGR